MADDAPTGEQPETPAATAEKPNEEPQVPEGADKPDAVKRALEAERKAAKEAKQRADAAEARVREFEEANASELEKAQNKVKRAEGAQADAEAKLLRYEVAQQKEVPAKLVPLLTATSKEDLEAQADLILENAKAPESKPDFDGGAREPAPEPKTPEQAHTDTILEVLGLKQN